MDDSVRVGVSGLYHFNVSVAPVRCRQPLVIDDAGLVQGLRNDIDPGRTLSHVRRREEDGAFRVRGVGHPLATSPGDAGQQVAGDPGVVGYGQRYRFVVNLLGETPGSYLELKIRHAHPGAVNHQARIDAGQQVSFMHPEVFVGGEQAVVLPDAPPETQPVPFPVQNLAKLCSGVRPHR